MVSVFFGKEDDQPEKMIMATKSAVDNGELYKCLSCDWLYTVRRKEVRCSSITYTARLLYGAVPLLTLPAFFMLQY